MFLYYSMCMFYKTFTVYSDGLIPHARRYVAYMSNDVEGSNRVVTCYEQEKAACLL
jgi:hypothetical protein